MNKYTLNAIVIGCSINLSNNGLRCLDVLLYTLGMMFNSLILSVFILIVLYIGKVFPGAINFI